MGLCILAMILALVSFLLLREFLPPQVFLKKSFLEF
ncbi:hypothetical protein CpecG_0532 [Chlamydia pecorum MC/MarsBar]|nr:hypothetical protein CpecF_0533 [Chlamydia pecorum DBDeUG]ETF38878.1 hypothetical protein CpecG_0532 [Chlamydia pecorum MC/MarsBar]ETF40371.1 hypothetical protein CpecA_0534 [Chlamydia pecorum IPTaLE]